jgi:hypothetical protein
VHKIIRKTKREKNRFRKSAEDLSSERFFFLFAETVGDVKRRGDSRVPMVNRTYLVYTKAFLAVLVIYESGARPKTSPFAGARNLEGLQNLVLAEMEGDDSSAQGIARGSKMSEMNFVVLSFFLFRHKATGSRTSYFINISAVL